MIATNTFGMETSAVRPTNEEEFLQVKGIGRIKTERYASLFIPAIREYLVQQGDQEQATQKPLMQTKR